MKLLKKCIVALLVVTSVFCVAPMFNNTVEAATKKVSTNYNADKLRNVKNINKIPSVKKGKTKVTLKKQGSYVKFTANKTKKYTFTFSNVKKGSGYVCGHVSINDLKGTYVKYFSSKKIKTYGGKTYALRLANRDDNYGTKVYRYKKSRSTTIKLKKGQTVYIYGSFAGSGNKASFDLKIK